jgi:hypothetical protein
MLRNISYFVRWKMCGRIREERIGFPAGLEELVWVSQQLAILHAPNDINILY